MSRGCCRWCRRVVPIRASGLMQKHRHRAGSGWDGPLCPMWILQEYPAGARILLDG